jgi:hypothetical protein
MAAVLTAVEKLVSTDYDHVMEGYHSDLDFIQEGLSDIEGLVMYKVPTGRMGQTYPMLVFKLLPGMDSEDIHARLLLNDPAIDIGYYHGNHELIFVNPIAVRKNELKDLLAGLRNVFLSDHGL